MRARWVFHDEPYDAFTISGATTDFRNVGNTIVASWFPGRYYKISTIQVSPTRYVTQIAKCDKTGWVGDWINKTLYEQQHENRTDAFHGHQDAVDPLARGRLRLAKVQKRACDL